MSEEKLEFKVSVKGAESTATAYSIELTEDAVTALLKQATPIAVGGDKRTEIAASVYSDIHKTLDDIHGRTDQIVRNYLLVTAAILSIYLGGSGQIDIAVLWLVPIAFATGTIQVGFMLHTTVKFQSQQTNILTEIGQSKPNTSNIFQLNEAPKQGFRWDFRFWGLAVLAVVTSGGLLCSQNSIEDFVFGKNNAARPLIAPDDLIQNAIVSQTVLMTVGGEELKIVCTVNTDLTMNCKRQP
jgi:hypothetical protein